MSASLMPKDREVLQAEYLLHLMRLPCEALQKRSASLENELPGWLISGSGRSLVGSASLNSRSVKQSFFPGLIQGPNTWAGSRGCPPPGGLAGYSLRACYPGVHAEVPERKSDEPVPEQQPAEEQPPAKWSRRKLLMKKERTFAIQLRRVGLDLHCAAVRLGISARHIRVLEQGGAPLSLYLAGRRTAEYGVTVGQLVRPAGAGGTKRGRAARGKSARPVWRNSQPKRASRS
jgi:hypothetical protein